MAHERRTRLEPGRLRERTLRVTDRALRTGALQPIDTRTEYIEEHGVRFVVRQVSSLLRKDAAAPPATAGDRPNPFLPYDTELYVGDISDTHVCLLNKYNVIEHHLLIVTRAFEDQQCVLTLPDFEALQACMAELDGLGFYNAGTTAGASQAHKHLQIATLPLAPEGPPIPIAPWLERAQFDGAIGRVPELPYVHAVARLDFSERPNQAARMALERYRTLLTAVGLKTESLAGSGARTGPYNLLVTRDWMMLVPRSCEAFDSISVNALGFAGALLVRDARQAAAIRQFGPLRLLQTVGMTHEVERER